MNNESNALVGEIVDLPVAGHAVNPYLSIIDKLVSQGGDLANLDRMLDLQIKWEANEARKAYVADMALFKSEPMKIIKNKHVSFRTAAGKTEYDHAELSDVTNEIVPRLAKHGFSHSWSVAQSASGITVICTITHRLGHSESVEMTAPADSSGGKNTIQSIGSTKTYLERYTLLAATGLSTEGQDDDGRGAEVGAAADELSAWVAKLEAANTPGEMRSVKSEMSTAYGKTTSIPKDLILAYNKRWNDLAEGDGAK